MRSCTSRSETTFRGRGLTGELLDLSVPFPFRRFVYDQHSRPLDGRLAPDAA